MSSNWINRNPLAKHAQELAKVQLAILVVVGVTHHPARLRERSVGCGIQLGHVDEFVTILVGVVEKRSIFVVKVLLHRVLAFLFKWILEDSKRDNIEGLDDIRDVYVQGIPIPAATPEARQREEREQSEEVRPRTDRFFVVAEWRRGPMNFKKQITTRPTVYKTIWS